jgi:streptogramin lyase
MYKAFRASSVRVGRSGSKRGWRIAGLAMCAVVALVGCNSSTPPDGPAGSSGASAQPGGSQAPLASTSISSSSITGVWEGGLGDPNDQWPVRMVLEGCETVGTACGEAEYGDPAQPDVVMCASELTLTGVDGDRFAFSEHFVYRPWMCLETTFTARMSTGNALEVEPSPDPDLCCRGTLAYVGAAKPADPIAELMTIAGLGRATSSAALGGATTQYVATGAGSLWFPLEDTGQVARVDAASGEVEALIDVGDPGALADMRSDPHGVAVGAAGIWVAQAAAKSVGRIDPATNSISESIPVGVAPYALVLDGTSLWLTSFLDDVVLRVDLPSGDVAARIPVDKPTGIAAGLGGVWAVEHRGDSVVRIDPKTNDIVAQIRLGDRGPNDTCGMCVENIIVSDGSVWTANNEAESVSRIDAKTNELAATIDLPMRAWAVTAGGGAIWASQFQGAPDGGYGDMSVARIDPATNQSSSFGLPALSVTWAGDALWAVTPGRRGDVVVRVEPGPS